jgi:uncharacterized protein (TIRG00374 family)
MSTKSKYLKIVVAIAIFAALFFMVDLHELWGALSQLTFSSILILAILAVALIYVSALKWGLFLKEFGTTIGVWRLFTLYLIGYFVNLILPSYLGGDAVRSYYIGKRSGQHEAFAATILERYTGIVAMVILAALFVWFVDGTTPVMRWSVVIMVFGLAGGTALALSPKLLALIMGVGPLKKLRTHFEKIQAGMRLGLKSPSLVTRAMALSFLFHLLTVANTAAAAYAIGWTEVPLLKLCVVVPVILIVSAIPLTPNSLGLQEGAFTYFLHAIGATPAEALGVALILRAKGYVLALIGGIFWLKAKDQKRIESAATAHVQTES